jgi:hypothetical protein
MKHNIQRYSTCLLPFALCLLLFSSCVKDTPPVPTTTVSSINSNNKVYIINEGQFAHVPGNANVSLYDATTGTVIENFYSQQNSNAVLGDVCQSMTKYNNNYYIVVNNSHKIEVASAYDLKQTATITGFNSPRYILPITYNKAYVSDLYANAIHIIDLNTNTITGSIPSYSTTEEMVLIYNKAFITSPSSNYCYVINPITDVITDSINVGKGASSIIIDKNSKVWVLASGSSTASQVGKLVRINPVTLQIELSLTFTPADSPNQLCINKTRDTLYYLNKGICQFPIVSGTLPAFPLVSQGSKIYYGLGINPVDYNIYVSDAIDYVQKSMIEIYSVNGSFKTSFHAGYISNGFMFE